MRSRKKQNPPFPVRCRTSSRERVESVRAHPHMILSDGKRGQVIHVHTAARALFRSDLRCSCGRGSRMAPYASPSHIIGRTYTHMGRMGLNVCSEYVRDRFECVGLFLGRKRVLNSGRGNPSSGLEKGARPKQPKCRKTSDLHRFVHIPSVGQVSDILSMQLSVPCAHVCECHQLLILRI
jgi:hypothetical protein